MRNLKRALSLTLASVMLLGMMIVGTSAASFKDADDISNVTAATVLQNLNIMVGDGENFMPDQIVTRGQMAIIICKILYGDKLNVSQFAGTTQYTDVKVDDYFNGYVNLATSLGIISGYGNGQFGPGDPVTTAQAALMLCKALGYFQAKELVGDWATDAMTAITKATQLKLFGSLNLATNEGLSRDNVAEMTFNTITKVTPVQYNELWNMYYTDSESIMSGVKFFYDETLGYRNYKLVYTDGEDAFGNPTTVWGTSDKTLKLKADGSIDTGSFNNIPQTNQITSAANKPLASYTAKVTLGTLYDLVGKSTVDDLKDSDEHAAKLTVVKDGETIVNGSKTAADVDSYFVKYSSDKVGGAGTLTKVYLDSDGAVTITMEQTYVFQASGDYNSRKESVRVVTAGDTEIVLTSSELSSDDFVNVKDVKDSDYLLITAVKQSGGKYDVKSVRPAQVVTGSVETYTVEDSVTIDGTKYGYSATAQKGDGHVVSTSYTVGQDASLVLDAYDNVIAIAEALNSSNYVYIKEAAQASGLAGGTVSADAFFTDGTNEVVNVVKAYIGSTATTNKAEIKNGIGGKWFTYSVNGSGEYTLYNIEKKYTQATGYYKDKASDNLDTVVTANGVVNFSTTTGDALSGNKESGEVSGDSVTLKANDNTILIVENNDNTSTAYVGVKNLPDITLNENLAKVVKMDYVNNDKGFTTYAFIDMSAISTTEGSVVDGAEAAEFVYVLDYKSQTYIKDMGTFFTYKALVDGSTEPEDKMFDAKLLSGDDEYALYYKARENKDGYVTTLPEVPATGKYFNKALDNQAITYSSGALNIGGTAYTLANDAQITLITLKGTNLNKDPGAKYEIASVTPKGLGDTLAKVMVTGNYAGELTEAGKTVIKTLYVTVAETTAKLDSDVTADEIEDALNTEGAATTPENAKIDKAVEVKKDQTLTLSETDKLNGDVTAKSGASVVIAGDVSGTGSVKAESGATIVIQNGSSAKVEAAAGSTVVIKDTIPTLAGGSSLAGTVKVGSVAVVGKQELPAGAGGTVIEGTVSIPADGVLTLSGEVTLGKEGAIMAAEGATIVVADEADVDALLGLEGVKFYDAEGSLITVAPAARAAETALPAGTYKYVVNLDHDNDAETPAITGWMLQGSGDIDPVAKKSEVVKAVMSEDDYNAVMPQFFGDGKKFPGYSAVATVTKVADGKLVVSSNGQGGLPYVTNFTAFNEAVKAEQSGYYVMVTFTVTKPEDVSSIADNDVIVTLDGGKTLKKSELGANSWDIAVVIHISADSVQDGEYTGGAMTYTIDADGNGTKYEATEYTLDFAGVTFKAQDDSPVDVSKIS